MFAGRFGTCLVILGVRDGVLVGADRRSHNTLTGLYVDETEKIIPLSENALAIGTGMANLVSDEGEIEVDILQNIKRIASPSSFKFNLQGIRSLGNSWIALMEEHLRRFPRWQRPKAPEGQCWFRSIILYRETGHIKGRVFIYHFREDHFPKPLVGWESDTILEEFVNGGKVLVEGDGSGTKRIEDGSAEFAFVPETRQACKGELNPATITVERGTRILQDILYCNHLYGEKLNGQAHVGDSCDIAIIDVKRGFRFLLRAASTAPDQPPLSE